MVRWLGVWFDQGLTFKYHVAFRVSQAKSTFYRMNRLANSERGLTPFAMRQLYLGCVTSVADYGCQIWWRGQSQFKRPLQALQNLGLRKILGVFKTAPTIPMEVEAALPPPSIRLSTSIRKYAFRALKLSPNHPIKVEIRSIARFTVNDQPTKLRFNEKPTQFRPNDQLAQLANDQLAELRVNKQLDELRVNNQHNQFRLNDQLAQLRVNEQATQLCTKRKNITNKQTRLSAKKQPTQLERIQGSISILTSLDQIGLFSSISQILYWF